MTLQKNLSNMMNALRLSRGQSITEFASELGISRSSLQDLLKGSCNPRIDTVEYIASQLHTDPAALLTCSYSKKQLESALLLLQLLERFSSLPREKQLKFASLFQDLVSLMAAEA